MDEEVKALLEEMKEVRKKQTDFLSRSDSNDATVKSAIKKLDDRLDELTDAATKLEDQKKRLDELETKMNRKAIGGDKGDGSAEKKGEEAYFKLIRKGVRVLNDEDLESLKSVMSPDEIKAISTDNDPDGGYSMPMNRSVRFLEGLVEVSPVRSLATVETISQGDSLEVEGDDVNNEFATGWGSERTAPTETATGKTRLEEIPTHYQWAEPKATQKSLDDPVRNFEAWITRKLSQKFGQAEGLAFVSGTGAGQPEGILVASGITQVNSGHASQVTGNGLSDIYYDLQEAYARNATWMMKRTTVKAIRQLKDSNGQYIWAAGLAGGAPATILNAPYVEAVDMPAVAANALSIIFGDFRAGYTIVDRAGMSILRDPFTGKPFVKFYTRRRVGGQVVTPAALRIQKIAA